MSFTLDFPLWTLVSWVMIACVGWLVHQHDRRIVRVERQVFPDAEPDPSWRYQSYHRAASEAVLQALLNPAERVKHIAEAEVYAGRALVAAETADQRKFTGFLADSLVELKANGKP